MNRYDLSLNVKSIDDSGIFSGYGSVANNIDSCRDVMGQGAFTKSLLSWRNRNKMPPVLWNHDAGQPIGIYTNISEDSKGLHVEGKLLINDVARAREIHALMKSGAVDGLSIGYTINDSDFDVANNVQLIKSVNLYEISIVTFPANEEARIERVKSALANGDLPTLPEFEKFLREAGFSKSQAVAIASHGLRQLLRDAATNTFEAKDISAAINILKGI